MRQRPLTAAACPDIGPLVERAGLSEWQTLCLHLLWERARGVRIFRHPYIDLLPGEAHVAILHPLLWKLFPYLLLRPLWAQGGAAAWRAAAAAAGGQHQISLVPWADVLNHSSAADAAACLARRGRSAARLFLDYGFVNDANANHSIDLPMGRRGSSKGEDIEEEEEEEEEGGSTRVGEAPRGCR
eukprot:jgi/Mesen1/9227/ME000595S08640